MRIAVSGAAGRMGRTVIRKALEKSLQIYQAFDIVKVGEDAGEVAGVGKIGVKIDDKIEELNSDVLIDFTNPEAALKNAEVAASKGIRIVMGTTGFNDLQRKKLHDTCSKVPSVVSPNFSVGVNVFFKIVEFAAKYLKGYDVEIVEIHHRHKKDAPSGTALRIAEIINQLYKKELKFYRQGVRGDEIGVFGIRGGDVIGEHIVFFFGSGERIELIHRATSRETFAEGAIEAAKWIMKIEKPGIYSMFDVLGLHK